MRNGDLGGERAMDNTEHWLNGVHADPVQHEAVDWLLRLQSAAAPQGEEAAFLAWMDQDARHVSVFGELFWTSYRAWAMSSSNLANLRNLIEQRFPVAEQAAKTLHPRSRHRIYAVAASVGLFVSFCAAVVHFGMDSEQIVPFSVAKTAVYDTPIGENRTIVLEDASRLTLGGRTRVEVALSKKERTVTLLEGEAYFEVAREQARSFKVHAGTVDVTAVGTAFNINRSNDSSVVTVAEGRVLVTPKTQRSGQTEMHGVYLNAGEQTTATQDSVGGVISVRDWPAVISWPTGRLSFRQRPLRDAIGDVNRYAQKPLVLAPEVGDIAVTGTLMINNIGSWVKSLERAFDLTAVEEPDRIVIRPNPPH
jgi:transmembrane sensor